MDDGIETTRTTVADGVRVRKTIDAGADGTAVVTLEVDLERDEPTTVRVVEPALGAVPRDDIELHTDHGAEYWQVGETATFEREFDAGESYEVVYRVAAVDEDRFEALDADTVVDTVDDAIDDLVDRDDSDAVRELIAGERESLAAPAAGGVELSMEADASEPTGDSTGGHAAEGAASEPTPDPVDVDAGSEPVDVDVDVDADADPGDVDAESEPIDVDAESEPIDVDVDANPGGDADPEPATEPASASSGGPAAAPSPEDISVDESADDISVDVPDGDGSVAEEPVAEAERATDDEPADAGAAEADEAETEAAATAGASATDEGPRSADLAASLAATPSGGLARVLLKELREGDVDEETREALREELGAEQEAGRSQDVRIKHLQSQVAEFSAYVEMLDGFVDEHGTFDSVFGEMSSLDEEVESLRSELDGPADAVEDVDEASAAVEDLRVGQDDLAARVERLEDELASIHDRLDEYDEFTERLSGAFQGVDDPQ
jgi:hypothetical protein